MSETGSMSVGDVTLVLLAGGAGSRMGKRKDLIRVCGMGLVPWMLERAAWCGPTMLVCAADGTRVEGEERVDVAVRDEVSGEGPLRGVVTAMAACRTSTMVVVPIDMPGIGARELAWVVERASESPDAMCVMTRRMVNGAERSEPFPSFYRSGFEDVARSRLHAGKRAMGGLMEEKAVCVVDAPREWGERVWANLNREDDVEKFEQDMMGDGDEATNTTRGLRQPEQVPIAPCHDRRDR